MLCKFRYFKIKIVNSVRCPQVAMQQYCLSLFTNEIFNKLYFVRRYVNLLLFEPKL